LYSTWRVQFCGFRKHFWNWSRNADENILHLNGTIAEESWFDDEITPALFKAELEKCDAPITVYINSPGGDCVAAAQIYNMLMEYPHDVTVKIDGIAASAASVVAMAGTKVLMSPVSTMMIHNPATIAMGDHTEMEKAIEMLDSVKESIINAYEIKTGLTRKELSKMMDAETWMDANKAIELGFADGILEREMQAVNTNPSSVLFSQRKADAALVNKMMRNAVPIQPLYDRLNQLR
jgi:ATP-dependent Clp protease protease subunit